ncbi:hypothetical protein J1N35_013060, partial [Gossypium stocksii]
KICKVINSRRGFVYGCTYCKLVCHIECLSPPLDLAVEDKSHQHTFTRLLRRVLYICDACGIEGIYVAYTCSTCSIMVHKRCTTFPRIIKSKWHDHRLFHKYFLPDEVRSSDCIICYDEVNPEHGSYCCSHFNITFHVCCVTEDKGSYSIVSLENEDEMPNESSIIVIERKDAGEATKIKHFKHMHNLMLGPFDGGYENSCNGGHNGKCNACGTTTRSAFCCKDCKFVLHHTCFSLPIKARHKCDEHLLSLTVHDDNSYSENHHCDICEKSRDANRWFYHCAICDTSAHVVCVLGRYPFFKLRCTDHPYQLTIVRKKYYNLDCDKYNKPCEESRRCDICEENRDQNCWFYYCATYDTSAHVDCVLENYPSLKLESIYEKTDHPHPLTIVKKKYYYPKCDKYNKAL